MKSDLPNARLERSLISSALLIPYRLLCKKVALNAQPSYFSETALQRMMVKQMETSRHTCRHRQTLRRHLRHLRKLR